MGIAEILTIIFIIAKVFHFGTVGHWGWWRVFSPMWIVYGIVAIIGIIFLILNKWKKK